MTVVEPSATNATAQLKLVASRCAICQIDDCVPIAVGADFEYATVPDEFLMVQCSHCKLVYLNPRPDDSELKRVYPDNYHAFQFEPEQFGLVYRVRRRLEARRLLRWCRELPKDARILDVGCGDGFHLSLLRDYGQPTWQIDGIDLDARAVAAAQKRGLNVQQGRVEEVDAASKSYHLILMIMTVEHLNDPRQTLEAVTKLLVPGGRLVIVTDNARSWDTKIFGGRHWGGYHFPRHTYLFSKQTLSTLAQSVGLQTERVSTAVSPVNWVYSIRNLLVDWGCSGWLVRWFSLKSPLSLGLFTLIDMPLSWLGCGAILHGQFLKPTEQAS